MQDDLCRRFDQFWNFYGGCVMSCISCFILKSCHIFLLFLSFLSSCESPVSLSAQPLIVLSCVPLPQCLNSHFLPQSMLVHCFFHSLFVSQSHIISWSCFFLLLPCLASPFCKWFLITFLLIKFITISLNEWCPNKASWGFEPFWNIVSKFGSFLEASLIINVGVLYWRIGCTAVMQRVDDPNNCAVWDLSLYITEDADVAKIFFSWFVQVKTGKWLCLQYTRGSSDRCTSIYYDISRSISGCPSTVSIPVY